MGWIDGSIICLVILAKKNKAKLITWLYSIDLVSDEAEGFRDDGVSGVFEH